MTGEVGYGQQGPNDSSSEFNAIAFLVKQMISQLSTMKLVKVTAVNAQGLAGGTVDVVPLVTQIDGRGNAVPHGTVFGVPFLRLQAGLTAIIVDPAVDDIGFVVCADRDISAVKTTKAQANPGSFRQYDLADGVYVGGVLNGEPTKYVRITADGIEIVGGDSITIRATTVTVTGDLQVSGAVQAGHGTGDMVSLQTHKHGVGTPAAGTSVPTPGL